VKILLVGQDKLDCKYGGGQVYVQNLVDALLANKQEFAYISILFSDIKEPQRVWSNYKTSRELQLHLPQSWQLNSGLSEVSAVTEAITQVLNEIKPDIIHAHGWKEYTCLAAFRCRIPCFVTSHHGGIICPAGALLNHRDEICTDPASYKNCIRCCVRAIPGSKLWLLFLRSLPVDFQLRLGRWLRKTRFIYFLTPLGTMALSIGDKLLAVETISKYATSLIAPANAIADALIRNGIPKEKVTIIPHGIPLPQKQPLRPDFGKGPMRFIFVGRISYVKGVHVMLEAFSQLKKDSYELHIVGGAITKPETRYMTHLKNKYTSLNVIWHGNKSHQEIPKYMAQCDVIIHPTICLEVYGLNIAEALAVGRPVIATRCGGAEMQIQDGVNGILVPPNDVLALRDATQSTIKNPTIIQKLANNEIPVISIEQHVKDLEHIYNTRLSEALL